MLGWIWRRRAKAKDSPAASETAEVLSAQAGQNGDGSKAFVPTPVVDLSATGGLYHGNTVAGLSGRDVSITQIYAPGGTGLERERFKRIGNAQEFSAEWLLFYQQNTPFIEREPELDALKSFLDQDASFSWWCVVGDGGVGKSRLALELCEQLPPIWEGGFLAKDKVAPSHAASWTPNKHTFWVVDYAAAYRDNLSRFLAVLARRFTKSPTRVRVLLLDRGYDKWTGWWANLTLSLSREQQLLNDSLYREPLEVAPFGERTLAFGTQVATLLGYDTDIIFGRQEERTDALKAELASSTGGGLALYVLMYIAEMLASPDAAAARRDVAKSDLGQSFLARELGRLDWQAGKMGLDYAKLVRVLFVTTTAYPVPIAAPSDPIVLTFKEPGGDPKNAQIVLYTDAASGKYRLPTLLEARGFGVDKLADNAPAYDCLNKAADIDDAEKYLAALSDAGASEKRRWALQPDILAETFARMMIRTLDTTPRLEAVRPVHDADRLTIMLFQTRRLNSEGMLAFWARMGAREATALVRAFARAMQTPRFALALLKEMNFLRAKRLGLKLEELLSLENFSDGRAAALAAYIGRANEIIRLPTFDPTAQDDLVDSELAWVLTYLEELTELDPVQRLRLCHLLVRKKDAKFFSRLSNTFNVLLVVRSVFAAVADQGPLPGGYDYRSLAIDAARFIIDRAAPAVSLDAERTPGDLTVLVNAALTTNFLIFNHEAFGYDGRDLYDTAVKLCDITRTVAAETGDEYLKEVARRHRGIVAALIAGGAAETWADLEQTMAQYVSHPIDGKFDFILRDYFWLAMRTQDIARLANLARVYLPEAIKHGFLPETAASFLDAVVSETLSECEALEERERDMLSLAEAWGVLARGEDGALVEAFVTLANFHVIVFVNAGKFEACERLFAMLARWMKVSACSETFIGMALQAYARALIMVRKLGGDLAIPEFVVDGNILAGADLEKALSGLSADERKRVEAISLTTVTIKDALDRTYLKYHIGIELVTESDTVQKQKSGVPFIEDPGYEQIQAKIVENLRRQA